MSVVENLLAFTFAATLLTLTPGLANAGCLLWGTAVAFGLGALIAVCELTFNLLKYCGAAYLTWLGLNMLLRPRTSLSPPETDGKPNANWFLKGQHPRGARFIVVVNVDWRHSTTGSQKH
jgi:threonine/homoserine/homoserine lactone efflux protein